MILNNIDLNKLRVFHAVIKYGNYQKAGDELGLTRSAISQSISTLEGQLGVRLFQRKGRRLYPTSLALDLSKDYAQSQYLLNNSLKRLLGNDSEAEGIVRVGSYYEFAKIILSKKIKEFSEEHPKSQFKLFFSSPSRLQNYLENGRIDLSFSIFPHEGSADIISKKVMEQELVLVSSKKFLNKAKSYNSMINLPVIEYYSSHKLIPKWVYTHFKKKPRNYNIKIFAASAEMLLKFIELEVGVGVMPKYLFDTYKNNNLAIVRPTSKKIIDYIWLNQYKNQFENDAHEKFFNFINSL